MASDRKQFNECYKARTEMLESGALSLPMDEGIAAIFCSYFSDWGDNVKAEKRNRKDIKIFRKEAFSIAKFLGDIGIGSEVFLNTRKQDIDEVLTDPDFASIYTIGHGNLSSFFVPGAINNIYDWTDVSEAADHLKSGFFVQRQCGGLERNFNAPLGMFAVSDIRNVIAAAGGGFEPRGLNHFANDWLEPVFDSDSTSYRDIKRLFPKDEQESDLD